MTDKKESCNNDCNQGKNCPVILGTHNPADALLQIEEPMNHTQKLNDEALQAYRATGLSPMELVKQRAKLLDALQELLDREWQDDEGDYSLEMARKKSKDALAQELEQFK